MSKSNEPKIAFCIRFGLYKWKVILFELCNAPTTFQAIMDDIFHHILNKGVVIYIDNILKHAENMVEYQQLVNEVLKRLDLTGLSINVKKSESHASKIEFLRYIISKEGIIMSLENVQVVMYGLH